MRIDASRSHYLGDFEPLIYVGSQPFGDYLISPMRVHQRSTSLFEHLKDEKDTEVRLDGMNNREIAASQEAPTLNKR